MTCCGAGDIHEAEPDYYLHLNARILAYAEETGSDTLMTVCNVCTLNLRQANHALKGDPVLLDRVNTNLESVGAPAYSGGVEVMHLLWLIAAERAARAAPGGGPQGTEGAQGRALLRLPDPPPLQIARLRGSGQAVVARTDHRGLRRRAHRLPAKIKCCGFPIIQAREEVALAELIQLIEQAREAGADAMVTPCPLPSLTGLAAQAREQTGKDFQMPVLHLSQLIGVAAGLDGGTQVQAPRRLGRARRREAVDLIEPRPKQVPSYSL